MQGKRRIELFGRDNNMRPGWVTVGKDITHSNFKASVSSKTAGLHMRLGACGHTCNVLATCG
jgi:N6-adenosine-specific RNA methylase IME4